MSMSKTAPAFLLVLFLFIVQNLFAQNPVKIHIVSDIKNESSDLFWFEEKLKEEILSLMKNRREIEFGFTFGNYDPATIQLAFDRLFADQETDIILGIGTLSSAILSQQGNYSKPAISGIIINPELQGVPITNIGTSGVLNYSYVKSPFSLNRDLEVLNQIAPYEKLGVFGSQHMAKFITNFEKLFSNSAAQSQAEVISLPIGENVSATLSNIPSDVDAIYVLPTFDELKPTETALFFEGLAERKIPSVALLGEEFVGAGALIGFEANSNLARMPRRLAINVSKVIEGINPSELPVIVETYSENLIINMATARKINIYPDWDLASSAILLNVNDIETKRSLNLKTAIFEALDNNLDIKVAKKNPILVQKDVDLAKSELLPQVDANTSLLLLDNATTQSSFGSRGRLNWAIGLDASQIIFAEPALANIAIQKLLKQSEDQGLKTTQLDVVLDAAESYLRILQARSFAEIQSENVKVTKNNLDIAKAKEAVGYSGVTDLYRWESELALDKIDLNDAQASVRQAQYALNQFLNRPIKESFRTEDVNLTDQLLIVTDERIQDLINNEGELEVLADFLVNEAMIKLPELKQVDIGIAAQDRLLLSQQRQNHLPSFALSGGWDYTIDRWDVPELDPVFQSFGLGAQNKPSWNVAMGVQYPIFQGMARQHRVEQTQVNILQLQDQRANLRNQLELRIRNTLETAGASYFRWQRSREAADAAKKNFIVIQDSYSQGLVNITTLIDAQNVSVQTELNAVNATYQFINDFLSLERAGGFYYVLATQGEKDAFFDRLAAFISKQQNN
jgi:outer membrane protein TolC